MPGMTAYVGLLDIGEPKTGETLVVSAASGAVGAVVGQIGKLKGCKVIGVAGSQEKCDYVVNELGFDYCLSHLSDDLENELASVCKDGVDVYFENVGGKVFDAVLPLVNSFARIPVCGLISRYSHVGDFPGPNLFQNLHVPYLQTAWLQGFNYGTLNRFSEFERHEFLDKVRANCL